MRIVYAILVLGLLASMSGISQAADLYRERGPSNRAAGAYDVRLRVVEQRPYCGDCEAPLGHVHSSTVRLVYVGYPAWERGCALGGCYGLYYVADSCYFREAPVRNARGRWVPGIKEVCD
jgi:hypothetical protein